MYWSSQFIKGPYGVDAAVTIGTSTFTFGGFNDINVYNVRTPMNINIFDAVKIKWSILKHRNEDNSVVPFNRFSHTVVAHGSKIYIWGGSDTTQICNTLYCFDTETLKWSTPEVHGDKPNPRCGHSACVINNCMYIFGGLQVYPHQLAEGLYMLNFQTMKWSKIETTGEVPSNRDLHSAIAIDNKMYIFGGRTHTCHHDQHHGNIYCQDLYYFDTTTRMWVCPTVDSDNPIGRHSHSAFAYNGYIYIFGGTNIYLNVYFEELQRYDPRTNIWSVLYQKGKGPCGWKQHISIVIDNKVFFYGVNPQGYFIDDFGDTNNLHTLDLTLNLKNLCLGPVLKFMKLKNLNINHINIPESLKNDISAVKIVEN